MLAPSHDSNLVRNPSHICHFRRQPTNHAISLSVHLGRIWLFLMLAIALVLCSSGIHAQQLKHDGKRKITGELKLVYPPLARKLHLTGKVRVIAVVAAEGHVSDTQVIGGSPVLVQAAVTAVSKSKWQPNAQETKEIIEISFQPESE